MADTACEQDADRKPPYPPIDQVREAVGNDESQYATGIKLAAIIASLILACFLMLIDTMVISTAIPRSTNELNSLADVGWYAGAYQFGSYRSPAFSGQNLYPLQTQGASRVCQPCDAGPTGRLTTETSGVSSLPETSVE